MTLEMDCLSREGSSPHTQPLIPALRGCSVTPEPQRPAEHQATKEELLLPTPELSRAGLEPCPGGSWPCPGLSASSVPASLGSVSPCSCCCAARAGQGCRSGAWQFLE